MADDKRGREEQARAADDRQRRRDVLAELERWEEPEPPADVPDLDAIEPELESLSYPATGADVVAAVGGREAAASDATYAVEELVVDSDQVAFEEPAAVRSRLQRPTVAAAMKRVFEASRQLPDGQLSGSQWDAYERTFRELQAVDVLDDDEGIRAIADWVVERIGEKGKLPGSRDVRREAATFCRDRGHEVRNDEWLGV